MAVRKGPVSYEEFSQRVRRHRRSDLLRLCARLNTHLKLEQNEQRPPTLRPNYVQPFSVAGVARTALISGNDHRSGSAELRDLEMLCWFYANVDEPVDGTEPGRHHLRQMMARLANEQFHRQLSPMEEVGRSLLLLTGDRATEHGLPSIDDWIAAFGASVHDLVNVGFVAFTAAMIHDGVVPIEHMNDDRFCGAYEHLAPGEALDVLARFYGSTVTNASRWGQHVEVPMYEKWSPSPLSASPVIELPSGTRIVPDPDAVIQRFSPGGLFYPALDAFGPSFPDALGAAFEAYVGTQLQLIQHATVLAEREYADGKDHKKTCDWFVVTDACVIIVEVKATRPILDLRIGAPEGLDDVQRKIGHAADQIDATAHMIQHGHSAVADIPRDRPLFGLIVTLEPFFWVDAYSYDDVLANRSVPICVTHSHELEGVVAALAEQRDAGTRLAAAYTPTTDTFGFGIAPQLGRCIDDLDPPPNPLLLDAWHPIINKI